MTAEALFDIAKNVAAICGAIVAVVAVWRIPAINGSVRWICRRLVSEPLGGWAQRQVGEVVACQLLEAKSQLQASTAWLSEGQERVGQEVMKLREDWAQGHARHSERLDAIDSKTRQLEPNGGKSIYDRIGRIEVAQLTSTALGDRLEAGAVADRAAMKADRRGHGPEDGPEQPEWAYGVLPPATPGEGTDDEPRGESEASP